jgi:hypothetical protein
VVVLLFTIYYYSDKIREDEMGGACSAHDETRNAYKIFVSLKGRDHSEDLGVDGSIIFK